MSKVAFIGLGVMGFPMAGHLKAKGYDVVVYNRTGAKADTWAQKHGGKSAPTPAAPFTAATAILHSKDKAPAKVEATDMGARIKELVEKLMEKVRELVAPPMTPVPVTPNRRRR